MSCRPRSENSFSISFNTVSWLNLETTYCNRCRCGKLTFPVIAKSARPRGSGFFKGISVGERGCPAYIDPPVRLFVQPPWRFPDIGRSVTSTQGTTKVAQRKWLRRVGLDGVGAFSGWNSKGNLDPRGRLYLADAGRFKRSYCTSFLLPQMPGYLARRLSICQLFSISSFW